MGAVVPVQSFRNGHVSVSGVRDIASYEGPMYGNSFRHKRGYQVYNLSQFFSLMEMRNHHHHQPHQSSYHITNDSIKLQHFYSILSSHPPSHPNQDTMSSNV